MSFLSGLGNIFHSIGHFFTGDEGGDNATPYSDPLKKQQQYQNQPAPQPVAPPVQQPLNIDPTTQNALNLFQGPSKAPVGPVPAYGANQPLVKANPNPAPAPAPVSQPAPQPHASIWHDITHNPLTDAIGTGLVKPAAEFGNAALHVPQALYREVQNKPISDIQQNVFGTTDSGTIAKKIIGDTGTLALTAAAPGISGLAEEGAAGAAGALAPEAASRYLAATALGLPSDIAEQAGGQLLKQGIRYGGGALAGGLLNTGVGATGGLSAGENPGQLLQKIPGNFATGAALGGLTVGAGDLFSGLKKAIPNAPDVAANEITPGIKSINPSQAEDAISQAAQSAPPALPVEPPVEQPQISVKPQPATPPIQQSLNLEQPPAQANVVDENGNIVTPGRQFVAGETGPANPQPAAPLEGAPAAPAEGARTAPNAPEFRAGLQKHLGDVAKGLEKEGDAHQVFSNPELTAAGKAVVDTMSNDEVLARYEKPVRFAGVSDAAEGKASLDRLSAIARHGTPEEVTAAQTAISNIVDAASEIQSQGGRVLNYGQEMLEGLPPEAKAAYYIKHLDALNEGVKGYQPIADDPAARNAVEANLMKFLTRDEEFKGQIADQNAILERATNPETRAGVSIDELKQAKAVVDKLGLAQRQNAGEMARYYDTLTPGRSTAEKLADWQRTSMLSSPTGRVHATIGTGLNVADQGAKDLVSGALGKVHNLFTAPEKAVRDTGLSPVALAKGAWQGLKKTGNEALGKFEVGSSLDEGLKNNSLDNSSEMNAFGGGKFKRIVNAATHSHSNLTQGIKDAELMRDAHAEGLQQGLKGEDLDKYTIARSAAPSSMMTERANEVHATMNNLNSNPLTDRVTKAANAIAGDSVVGNVIKNQILPFPRFVAGNIWNQVTDRNVVAAGLKTVASALKGDTQGVIDNVAKLGVEGAKTYALGWVLTQHGVLVNHDAQGNTYDGAYLHIGDRYIPASTLGFIAPSLVIGNATYNAFNDPKTHTGSFADHLGNAVTEATFNLYKSVSGSDLLGTGENIATPINQAAASKDPSKLLKIGTNIAGQNIPAATGDVNAVLNQTNLNPTHEAAQTTVKNINPDTGREKTDSAASAEAQLANRIPGLSQGLPRQAGVASADLTDRTLRSDRETGTEKQAAVDKKTAENRAATLKAGDIPDPNGKYKNGDSFEKSVQTRIENGDYDKAIQAYQAQLDDIKSDKERPKSEQTDLENKIKTLQVTKGYDPSIIDLYKKTSLSEWRDMGDDRSDNYDPQKYNLLYQYDSALAKAGVSTNATKTTDNKYSVKKPSKSGRGSAASQALEKIKSNTIGSLPSLGKVSFGNLAPQKIANIKIPTIQQVQPGELIKQRTISSRPTR